MKRMLWLIVAVLLVPIGAVAGDKPDPQLMTYERFLEVHGLKAEDLESRNCFDESVRNPRTGEEDSTRRICEIWIKTKVIPEKCTPAQRIEGRPVKFNDGTQAYSTRRVWTEMVPQPRPVEKEVEVVVKADEETIPDVQDYKRYVLEKP